MVALVAGIGPSYPYTAASRGTRVTLTHSHGLSNPPASSARLHNTSPPDQNRMHIKDGFESFKRCQNNNLPNAVKSFCNLGPHKDGLLGEVSSASGRKSHKGLTYMPL